MRSGTKRKVWLLATTIIAGMAVSAGETAGAQTPSQVDRTTGAAAEDQGRGEIVVVTGSRIPRSSADTTTPAPVTFITAEDLTDRGFVQAGEALNDATNIPPSRPIGGFDGSGPGTGTQFPSLFNLGPGRTLTLVNGRRFVSSNGTGDSIVDTNLIPTGLMERIDIVSGGGAAVYGSDAIAGVVNYVLRDDFEGLTIDAQFGDSERRDYPVKNARITWGADMNGRGNVAVNLEWSETAALWASDRPEWTRYTITQANPANTSNSDGIPGVTYIPDARFWEFNYNGVLFAPPDPTGASCGGFPLRCFVTINGVRWNQVTGAGVAAQFDEAGTSLVGYNPGTFISPGPSIPTASGGQGFDFSALNALSSPVERTIFNALGHYDLNDKLTLSAEILLASTTGSNPQGQPPSNTILNSAATGSGPIPIRADNPFLSASARTTIINYLNSTFLFGPGGGNAWGAGAPLPVNLSKIWYDLTPSNEVVRESEVFRINVALDGELDFGGRTFDWQLSASQAGTDTSTRSWGVWQSRFANAIDTRLVGGQPVCAINANASSADDDPLCTPINPFGVGNVSQAARDYVSILLGSNVENNMTDYLATLGGNLFSLPAGEVGFSLAYEHRREDAEFRPTNASRLGLGRNATPQVTQGGAYHTNEYSIELLVPIFGGDVRLPLVDSLELSGAFRYVDNSIAGEEDVWGSGLRWGVFDGLLLRASRSRNFRAPTLTQLFAPQTTALGAIGVDPCDADRIAQGPAPATRAANCLALFQANPGYGVPPAAPGASAQARLATFQDPAENFASTLITSGGNPDLRNELSDTFTYGFVFQPTFLPGLTIVADRVEVDLTDGLSAFTPANFLAACFDSAPQPADICSISTRDAAGTVVTSRSTTFNAGRVTYRGEIYNINYQFDIADLFGGDAELGDLELALEATHNDRLETSVTGFDRARSEDTVQTPDWVYRFDARYSLGDLRLAWTANYRPSTLFAQNATIETHPFPVVDENWLHSLGARYRINDRLTIRGGVNNLFDEGPSAPTTFYGDILGRRYYVGLTAEF